MRVSKFAVKVMRDFVRNFKPSLTDRDVAFALQCMDHPKQHPYMSIGEACRLTGKSKYLVRKALDEAGVKLVMMRPCPGGEEPIYNQEDMMAALGYERTIVEGE